MQKNEKYENNDTPLKLPVTFGISFNKFTAKMATNLGKPNGIFLINNNDFQKKVWPLKINKFYGIGPSTTKKKWLIINIKTIRDLSITPYDSVSLKRILGKNYKKYIDLANGVGSAVIKAESNKPKSISKSITFDDSNNIDQKTNNKKQ